MIGRLLRAEMRDRARETPERIAERIRSRAIEEQILREIAERFGEISSANAAEVLAWQASRRRDLIAAPSMGETR